MSDTADDATDVQPPGIELLLRLANAAALKYEWVLAADKYNECLKHNAQYLPAIVGLFVQATLRVPSLIGRVRLPVACAQAHATCLGCSGKCAHFKQRDALLARANEAAKLADKSSPAGNGNRCHVGVP